MNQKIYKGLIKLAEQSEEYEALFIGDEDEPLAEGWGDLLHGKQVTVRYWISDNEQTKEQLKENQLLAISGAVYADYGACYSELTGYLWTDETLKVGGHDLIYELQSNVGKYLYMEVDY
jgi:hypothetical protein